MSVHSYRSCRKTFATSSLPQSILRRAYNRPPNAPKPILDIKHIRQNPGLYAQNCVDRNYAALKESPWKILDLHNRRQLVQKDATQFRKRNNALRRQLAKSASMSGDAEGDIQHEGRTAKKAVLEEARHMKEQLGVIDRQEKELEQEMEGLAWALPNLSSQQTPVGEEPAVMGYINEHPESLQGGGERVWKSHVDIGSELSLLDFTGAATTSGWGWYYLMNEAALLEQALIQYALSVARKRGWIVVSPPSVVYSHMAAACGFQPRDQSGEQQTYALEQPEKDKAKPSHVLAATAEIPLAGLKANQILDQSHLPLKMIGVSRCYRAEAGARGVDTKGLYRVHEFTKVEMFAWTKPDPSDTSSTDSGGFSEQDSTTTPAASVFTEMLEIQKEILHGLGLHCRILEMPTTDLGASATRKIDIEAWFPSRREHDGGWGELTSASNCTDYQSRRLSTRLQAGKGQGQLSFPYTLNGTALAVPRVLAALLENGWEEEQRQVAIPDVLRPWMDGMECIQR